MVLHTTLKRIHVRMRTRPITVPDTSAGVIMAKVNLQAGRAARAVMQVGANASFTARWATSCGEGADSEVGS